MEALKKMQQRVYGAAVLQMAAQTDLHVIRRTAHAQDRDHVGQRLGRMEMAAIARIDRATTGLPPGVRPRLRGYAR